MNSVLLIWATSGNLLFSNLRFLDAGRGCYIIHPRPDYSLIIRKVPFLMITKTVSIIRVQISPVDKASSCKIYFICEEIDQMLISPKAQRISVGKQENRKKPLGKHLGESRGFQILSITQVLNDSLFPFSHYEQITCWKAIGQLVDRIFGALVVYRFITHLKQLQ